VRVRSSLVAAVVVLACAACSSSGGTATTTPSGPPEIQDDVVVAHAGQFDGQLADRPAGSQREFAAAAYILTHLQEAGYAPLLDPVPVQDLIRSTDVIANPPRAGEPDAVVAIPYDTTPTTPAAGTSLGTWLELARALYALDPDHTTGFVALGAEHATVGGGRLGSRRFAEYLIDGGLHPLVITFGTITEEGAFAADGTGADELNEVARSLGLAARTVAQPESPTAAVFAKAGFRQATVSGSVDAVGRVLLAALADGASPSASPR
jgi:hypothetical protein